MADFIALYRGRTVSEAELVAISAEARLVERFFAELLEGDLQPEPKAEEAANQASVLELVRDD